MRDVMGSLTRLVLVRLRHDERGVVGVIVALLIGAGVLTGMCALVIDVGQIYQERAELQNGADAAALGVAKSCALGACTPGVAGQLADGNASNLTGRTEGVALVCGSGSLGSCPASTGSITDCPPPPPAGTNFVDVYTATQTASGSTLLPPVFATTLLGNSSYRGTTVRRMCSGRMGRALGSDGRCSHDLGLRVGSGDAARRLIRPRARRTRPCPRLRPGPHARSRQRRLRDSAHWCVGATFGWAVDEGGGCTLPVSGSSFPARPEPMSPACQQVLQNAQQSQTPILVPIYASFDAVGNKYAWQGFADFVVTGYNLPGFEAADWLDSTNSCQGTDYCLTGYFVQGVIPATGSLDGTDLGASVIDLTG